MKQNETKKSQKSPCFFCEKCEYITGNKKDYDKHILTSKHLNETNMKQEKPQFFCICNKMFNSRTTLWRHKKTCIIENTNDKENKDEPKDNELIQLIIKENAEFKNLILDVCKNFQSSTVNNMSNSHNNSHNKTFNLQVFLNETCKDAMNIMDFADSIKLQLIDLENVGEYGFVNGISKIIIKSLQEMDVNLRPVHCSDLKREVAYVKENGIWEKDSPDNKLMKKAIKRVANRNIRQINEWKKLYPDCGLSDSKKSNQYNELVIEAMGGRGDDDEGKANKIVKKIMKNVVIDKNML